MSTRKWVAAGMASLFFMSTTALTAVEAGAALKEIKRITVKQGLLRGIVVNAEGKSLVKAVIDVRDSKGDVVSLGITKNDGSFSLASVPDGEYLLSVNGEFTYSLQVAKDAGEQTISLVVPAHAYSAGAIGDSLTRTQLIVGGVVTGGLLLGLAIASNSNDDCSK